LRIDLNRTSSITRFFQSSQLIRLLAAEHAVRIDKYLFRNQLGQYRNLLLLGGRIALPCASLISNRRASFSDLSLKLLLLPWAAPAYIAPGAQETAPPWITCRVKGGLRTRSFPYLNLGRLCQDLDPRSLLLLRLHWVVLDPAPHDVPQYLHGRVSLDAQRISMGGGDPKPGVCYRRAEEDRRRGGALERRTHGVQAHVQGAVGELLERERTLDQTVLGYYRVPCRWAHHIEPVLEARASTFHMI
jgi:hypothetical protein